MDIKIDLDPLWVSILVTITLVIITGLYMRETRKIRLESIRPIFSLRTGLYTIGGECTFYFQETMGELQEILK